MVSHQPFPEYTVNAPPKVKLKQFTMITGIRNVSATPMKADVARLWLCPHCHLFLATMNHLMKSPGCPVCRRSTLPRKWQGSDLLLHAFIELFDGVIGIPDLPESTQKEEVTRFWRILSREYELPALTEAQWGKIMLLVFPHDPHRITLRWMKLTASLAICAREGAPLPARFHALEFALALFGVSKSEYLQVKEQWS